MSVSHLEVSATLLEALSQHGDHVFVVVQQLLHQFTEPGLLVLILDLQTETSCLKHTSPFVCKTLKALNPIYNL